MFTTFTRTAAAKLRASAIKGNQHFTSKQLDSYVSVNKASWLWFSHGAYSQGLLRTSAANLTANYRAAGYSEAAVVPKISRNGENINMFSR